jgi:hypothetical protein
MPCARVNPFAQTTLLKSSSRHGGEPSRTEHSPTLESNSFHPGQQLDAPPGRPEHPAPPQRPHTLAQHAAPSGEVTPAHVGLTAAVEGLRKRLECAHPRSTDGISATDADDVHRDEARARSTLPPRERRASLSMLSPDRVSCTSHVVSGRQLSSRSFHESLTEPDEVGTARGPRSILAVPRPGNSGCDASP